MKYEMDNALAAMLDLIYDERQDDGELWMHFAEGECLSITRERIYGKTDARIKGILQTGDVGGETVQGEERNQDPFERN